MKDINYTATEVNLIANNTAVCNFKSVANKEYNNVVPQTFPPPYSLYALLGFSAL
jgi:hypothetical protein